MSVQGHSDQPHSRVRGQWHRVLWWLSTSDLFIYSLASLLRLEFGKEKEGGEEVNKLGGFLEASPRLHTQRFPQKTQEVPEMIIDAWPF